MLKVSTFSKIASSANAIPGSNIKMKAFFNIDVPGSDRPQNRRQQQSKRSFGTFG